VSVGGGRLLLLRRGVLSPDFLRLLSRLYPFPLRSYKFTININIFFVGMILDPDPVVEIVISLLLFSLIA